MRSHSLLLLLVSLLYGTFWHVSGQCSRPKAPANGNRPRLSRSDGVLSAIYTCKSSFRLVGARSRRCVYSGARRSFRWQGKQPSCIRNKCGFLPNPPNGRVTVNTGSIVAYVCNTGYSQVGNSLRSCSRGQWSGSAPNCCRTLLSPANGAVNVQRNQATYSCQTGYRLVGNPTRVCTNSVWNGTDPLCLRTDTCPALVPPMFGRITLASSGKIAIYFCNNGYRMVGSALRFCRDGSWTSSEPRCERVTCPRLSRPSNGLLQVSNNVARFSCLPGFNLVGDRNRRCVNGVWSGSNPFCNRITVCEVPRTFTNGFVRASNANTILIYSCRSGYTLRGDRQRMCSNGVWSGRQPSCVMIPCPRLAHPANGFVRQTNVRATYGCNGGFSRRGGATRTCANGVWNGRQPRCVRNCPRLERPSNGNVNQMRTSATYSCNPGFELRGSSMRTCRNGIWIGQEPVCRRTSSCVTGSQWRDRCNRLCTCVRGEPRCCRERKEIESMTTDERRLYVDTVITASTDRRYQSDYEDLLEIHEENFHSGIHGTDQFLPWHRWFVLQYENLLRRVNCNVTLPYWDWSLWAIRPFDATLWSNGNYHLGGNGVGENHCVRDGRFRQGSWSLPDNRGCLRRDFNTVNVPGEIPIPGTEAVQRLLRIEPNQFRKFELTLRVPLHGEVHGEIGGTMMTTRSAYAPEFFLHHGYIDKLWADWQKRSRRHRVAHFSTLTTPMVEAGSTTPADVVDNDNLPGGVRVCFAEPGEDVGIRGMIETIRARSNFVVEQVMRPKIKATSESVMDLFGVSAEERKMAASILKDMETGADIAAPTTAPDP